MEIINETLQHEERVGEKMARFAEYLGYDKEFCKRLKEAGKVHDTGKSLPMIMKIAALDRRLTEQEYNIMKRHAPCSYYKLLRAGVKDEIILNVALYHHENFDGTGYPTGLKGEEIPIEARIAKICDVYDALRNKRVYKDSMTREEAIAEMEAKASQYDKVLLKAFKEFI